MVEMRGTCSTPSCEKKCILNFGGKTRRHRWGGYHNVSKVEICLKMWNLVQNCDHWRTAVSKVMNTISGSHSGCN